MPEIGFLCSGSKAEFKHLLKAFGDGLKVKGYKLVTKKPKGRKDVRISAEWADGDYSKLAAKAKALIGKRVDVVAATGGLVSVRAAEDQAEKASSKIPIIFIGGREKPKPGEHGANTRGIHLGTTKEKVEDHHRYRTLRKLVGSGGTISQIINKHSKVNDVEQKWPKPLVAGTVKELDAAFKTASGANAAKAVLVSADPFFHRQRAKIVGLAKKYKIAACYPWREYVDAGGLMSHGPNLANAYRRLGIWAGLVLDGTRLGDLPNADAGERELVVNLKTAKALGVTVPDTLLLAADAVIQ